MKCHYIPLANFILKYVSRWMWLRMILSHFRPFEEKNSLKNIIHSIILFSLVTKSFAYKPTILLLGPIGLCSGWVWGHAEQLLSRLRIKDELF